MTKDEALAEAKKRWGKHGYATDHGTDEMWRIYEVWALPYERGIYGIGKSYEDAFRDAADRPLSR